MISFDGYVSYSYYCVTILLSYESLLFDSSEFALEFDVNFVISSIDIFMNIVTVFDYSPISFSL